MRSPFRPEDGNHDERRTSAPRRDPSYVDRRRLDSDVRAFLRQPSTPWVVFDRDSGVPRELAPGTVLSSAASSAAPGDGFFPPTAPTTPTEETSTAAVVSEVAPEEIAAPPPRGGLRARALAVAIGTGIGVVVFGAIGAAAFAHDDARPPRPPKTASASFAPPEPAPPDLDPRPARATSAPAPVSAPATPSAPPRAAVASVAPKGRFGKLSIAGAARYKQVYLDGKRLLGSGGRSFTVFCGPHMISINSRTDGRDVDIPCNGEFVVAE